MKRILAFFLCVVLLFPVGSVYAFADGEGNMDDGGGGMGGGTGKNFWNPGDDGVRVTVVRTSDNKPVSRPIDLTNKNEKNVIYSFVKKSKLHYRNGATLEPNLGTYTYVNPSKPMPRIITSSGGNANITEIRSYFTDHQVIVSIARIIGTSYEKLTDVKYPTGSSKSLYFPSVNFS